MPQSQKTIIELCRKLRKTQTPVENLLWQKLRERQFFGLKFLRQYPLVYSITVDRKDFFVADFYCAEKKIVIELDGKIHDFQKDYDTNRDKIMASKGLKVIRLRNEELDNIEQALEKLKKRIL